MKKEEKERKGAKDIYKDKSREEGDKQKTGLVPVYAYTYVQV
jgi:hypothetical protein